MNPGVLYMVATPIGHLGDISARALEVLGKVDVIAAEDTRHSKRLLNHYGIKASLVSLHQHNEKSRASKLILRLLEGESVALISDAGTPAINDPGALFVEEAHQQGIQVAPIPGPCSFIAALSASGLSATPFYYAGFLPSKRKERISMLEALKGLQATLIFLETPHRLKESLVAMQGVFGAMRLVVLAKELTKIHEQLLALPISELVTWTESHQEQCRGEFVLLVEGASETPEQADLSELAPQMVQMLSAMPLKQVVDITQKMTGYSKNELYDFALSLKA